MFKEVMNDLWLARISSLSNEVGLYVVLQKIVQHELLYKLGLRPRGGEGATCLDLLMTSAEANGVSDCCLTPNDVTLSCRAYDRNNSQQVDMLLYTVT